MANEYLPIYLPGQRLTLKASAPITAGQLLEVSGDGTVAPAAAGSLKTVGVAGFDAAQNDNVTVYAGGVQKLVAAGAVTAGDQVAAAAAGKAATCTTGVLGVALSTAADGAPVRVLFNR